MRNGMSFAGKETFYKKKESGSKILMIEGPVDSDPNVTATFLASGLKSAMQATEETTSLLKKSPLFMVEREFSPENLLTMAKIGKATSLEVTPFIINESNRQSKAPQFLQADQTSSVNQSNQILGHLGSS